MLLEMFLSGSALILAVMLIRAALGSRIGARLRYGLWLLVLLRLLLPVSLGESSLSPANLARQGAGDVVWSAPIYHGDPEGADVRIDPDTGAVYDAHSMGYAAVNTDGTVTRYAAKTTLPDALPTVWKAGMAVTALWFALCNLLFWRNAVKTRRLLRTLGGTKVYAANVPSPCLFGLLRPAIYVTEQAVQSGTMRHVLLHEKTHLCHGDHIWAFLRTVCLIVWWFNPLVWAAAALSRRDCELACDESVIRRLGAEHRAAYGRTLLQLTRTHRPVTAFCAAATLSGGRGQLRRRIEAIARWAKPRKWAVAAALALAVLTAGCAFTGGSEAAAPAADETVNGLTAAQAMDALEASVTFDPEDGLSFTVPAAYETDEWSIELFGRSGYSSQHDGSIYPLAEVTRWKPGETYVFAHMLSVWELSMTFSLPGEAPRQLTFLPADEEESRGDDTADTVEPDFAALFETYAADPAGETGKMAHKTLRGIPATVHYAFRYFVDHPGCLDGLAWDDQSVPAYMLRTARSMLGGADMPLETDTMGEWWAEYVDLACRIYPDGTPFLSDEEESMQLPWYLARMVDQAGGIPAEDTLAEAAAPPEQPASDDTAAAPPDRPAFDDTAAESE